MFSNLDFYTYFVYLQHFRKYKFFEHFATTTATTTIAATTTTTTKPLGNLKFFPVKLSPFKVLINQTLIPLVESLFLFVLL